MDGQAPATGGEAWAAVQAAFGALGRVVLLLDPGFRVVRASASLDELTCQGTQRGLEGRPVGDLLGSRLFVPGDAVHRALCQGKRQEGRRAFLKCPKSGAQLVSLSVAPIPAVEAARLHADARFMVVLRPADAEEPGEAEGGPRHGLLARSTAMLQIVSLIEALSESEATVLVTGESGTGKEVVARALHAHSPRSAGPFVTVNTGAIPSTLLESELFGHVRGAFTGAVRDRPGRIELARGGTLFLDEIGDMPMDLQVKLLRVVQEREFQRLGESRMTPVDARLIAATHVDLEQAVRERRFREDLYYRLRVVPIHIPPLRQRREEIPWLAQHLLARIGAHRGRALRLSPDAEAMLVDFDWPGNVRQLENALEHAVALCRGQTVQQEHLPADVLRPAAWPAADEAERALTTAPAAVIDAAEAPTSLRQALEQHRWNRQATADALGISRTTLWRRMREQGLA